jgi:hypothetical protein
MAPSVAKCDLHLSGQLMRMAIKAAKQNDRDFVTLILL